VAAVRALIDTNIWVSSLLNPFGFPARLRKSFEEGEFNAVISAPMLEELSDVLNRPKIKDKFEIEEEDITRLLFLLEDRAEDIRISGNVTICRDKDDDFVIETAIKGRAEYLVTRPRLRDGQNILSQGMMISSLTKKSRHSCPNMV
jgi:putative PIN family toxin of toxin-antitoxin system